MPGEFHDVSPFGTGTSVSLNGNIAFGEMESKLEGPLYTQERHFKR